MKLQLHLLFISIILSFATCSSPQKKEEAAKPSGSEKPTQKSLNSEPNQLSMLESISDGRALPTTSAWSEDKYKQFDETNFKSFSGFSKRILMTAPDMGLLNASIFFHTNLARKQVGMKPLQYSKALEEVAFSHSQDMVTYNFYNHVSPVRGKETFADRLGLVGIEKATAIENIGNFYALEYKSGTPIFTPEQNGTDFFSYSLNGSPIPMRTYESLGKDIVEHWMNSPAHRRNVLNPGVSFLGCGAYIYEDPSFHRIARVKTTQVLSGRSN